LARHRERVGIPRRVTDDDNRSLVVILVRGCCVGAFVTVLIMHVKDRVWSRKETDVSDRALTERDNLLSLAASLQENKRIVVSHRYILEIYIY